MILPRRHHVCLAAAAGLLLLVCSRNAGAVESYRSAWSAAADRVWVGPELWANRLQDWKLRDGRLECVESRANRPLRTVHLLTHRLAPQDGELRMSVRTGLVDDQADVGPRAAAGFLLGAGTPDLDWRAAALVHHSPGRGGGLLAGIDATGRAYFRDLRSADAEPAGQGAASGKPADVVLRLSADRQADGTYRVVLAVHDPADDKKLSEASLAGIAAARLVGNLALVSHPGAAQRTGRFWFRDWHVEGSKLDVDPERLAGPVLCTQYTQSRGVLKLTAQFMPIAPDDEQQVALEIERDGKWQTAAEAKVVVPGYTATFRVADWDAARDTPYRAVYRLKRGGARQEFAYRGTIRRDPVAKRSIVVAGFTGNHNARSGVEQRQFDWSPAGVWFPHNDVVRHVAMHQPDLLFFSGDQVYEGGSPTAPDRSGEAASYLDYLYKWYLWCWAFGDLTRDIPCVCIPDDHDVFQPNLWGHGGRPAKADHDGGYVMPPDWVRMVERTQTSHLPDPFDPTPIEQGIGVYYTALVWGRIGFAVIEDRKFKSGCNGLVPPTTSGRPDHVVDPDFDPATADVPEARLLGDRQLAFLRHWAADWRGTDMKAVLSQTVFANVATHHGPQHQYLVADYDSNGWPQRGRNQALHEMRRGFAFMIGGDQHLATIVHHGINEHGDAGWSFCVPSIANFYPRAWRPPQAGRNRPEGLPDYTGEFRDGLGNKVTVWAATNPGEPTGRQPAALHDRMPGYGIVRFDKVERTITMECWPRYADPNDPATGGQYAGWPKTIHQLDNYARRPQAWLPTLHITGRQDPVVQVIEQQSGESVYTLRLPPGPPGAAAQFRPRVYLPGVYTIKVGDPDTDTWRTIENVPSADEQDSRRLDVVL